MFSDISGIGDSGISPLTFTDIGWYFQCVSEELLFSMLLKNLMCLMVGPQLLYTVSFY